MYKIFIVILLGLATTSVFASDFSWSRANHNRLDGFIRSTKLPPGQYVIGVYSTGNTITEYVPEIIVVEKLVEIPIIPPPDLPPVYIDLGGKLEVIEGLARPLSHPHRPY